MNWSDLIRSSFGCLTLLSSLIVPVWSVYVHRAPDLPSPNSSTRELLDLKQKASNMLTPVSFNTSGPRPVPSIPPPAIQHFSLRRADNLDLFIDKREFEDRLFPIREEFVRNLGSCWCESHSSVSRFIFRPSVRFRSLSSGETLASYECANSQTEFHSGE